MLFKDIDFLDIDDKKCSNIIVKIREIEIARGFDFYNVLEDIPAEYLSYEIKTQGKKLNDYIIELFHKGWINND